jgi:hypothetical protein
MKNAKARPPDIMASQISDRRKYRFECFMGQGPRVKRFTWRFGGLTPLALDQAQIGPIPKQATVGSGHRQIRLIDDRNAGMGNARGHRLGRVLDGRDERAR